MLDTDRGTDELKLLGINEVATLVGVSRSTIDRMVKREEFPRPIKMGLKVKWQRKTLQGFIEGRT
jgi:excisionase family DNA binding protein